MSNFLPGFENEPPIVLPQSPVAPPRPPSLDRALAIALALKLQAQDPPHRLLRRGAALVVTNASSLSDDDRQALKAAKTLLLPLLPPMPVVQAPAPLLVQFLGSGPREPDPTWRLPEFPNLSGVKTIVLNFEATGKDWWGTAETIGVTIGVLDNQDQHLVSATYLPYGHRPGGNLPKENVFRFLQDIREKHILNQNTIWDVLMARKERVSFEDQGNTVSDISHYAALLDDDRKRFNLDLLATDFLPGGPQIPRIDESRMAGHHPAEMVRRAEYQVQLVAELRAAMWPLLDKEDLQRVRALEDAVIYPTAEMQWNGVPLDMERLDRWERESEKQYTALLWQLHRDTGLSINPDSDQDMTKLFHHLHLPITRLAPTAAAMKKGQTVGSPSFTDAILSRFDHPTVIAARRAIMISGLRSKFLVNLKKCVSPNGILHYALHQLRYNDDDGDEGGVGPGRFSSSALDKKNGVGRNIQNIIRTGTQRQAFGYAVDDTSHDEEIWLIRKLMIPGEGQWCSADARQIEFRNLVSDGNITRFIDAYKKDPLLSFHKMTLKLMQQQKPDMTYDEQKTYNYAFSYGAKKIKQAVMLGFITEERAKQIRDTEDWDALDLKRAADIEAAFNKVLPEAKQQLDRYATLAKNQGYITSLLGRRIRFTVKTNHKTGQAIRPEYHKALNSRLQSMAADYGKAVMVEVHKNRKFLELILRYVVHDSIESSSLNPAKIPAYHELLDTQLYPDLIKVPILFDVGLGANWSEAH